VSALDVVPFDAVAVKVVEDANACFVVATLTLLPVVGLVFFEAACVRPEAVPTRVGTGDSLSCRGPVPAILYGRLEIRPITSVEVALSSACPNIVKVILLDDFVDPV